VHLPLPFLCDKVDAGPSELQLNSEILFFAKAPGAQLKAIALAARRGE